MVENYNQQLVKRGIVKEFHKISWEDFKNVPTSYLSTYKKIIKVSDRWISAILENRTDYGLFLYGFNGCGKSAMGCLILKTLFDKGKQVYRIPMPELQQDYFKTWRISSKVLVNAVLFLDEIGKDYSTKAGQAESILQTILKYRTERLYPTILASNSSIEDLLKKYGKSVESLIMGKFFPVNFPEMNFRSKNCADELFKFFN